MSISGIGWACIGGLCAAVIATTVVGFQIWRCRRAFRAARFAGPFDVVWEPAPAPAKPRVRVLPGGWIRHTGGSRPVPAGTPVRTLQQNEWDLTQEAGWFTEDWWRWTGKPGTDIIFYRVVSPTFDLSHRDRRAA